MATRKKTDDKTAAATRATPDPSDSISIELRKAREEMGLTFSDLHKLTGISRTTLHDYESTRSKPGAREIRLLCDVLKISPNRLIYGTEDLFKEKSRLHALLEVTSEDLRTARLTMFLMMLSKDERDAWITILGESIKLQTGGGERFDQALDAIEDATEAIAGNFGESLNTALSEQRVAEIGQAVEAKIKDNSEKRKTKR